MAVAVVNMAALRRKALSQAAYARYFAQQLQEVNQPWRLNK
jgi:hypothetical protein